LDRSETSNERFSFLCFCQAMFTLYADSTNHGSMDTLVVSQVKPCQSNLMLLSLIDPNVG